MGRGATFDGVLGPQFLTAEGQTLPPFVFQKLAKVHLQRPISTRTPIFSANTLLRLRGGA